MHVMEIVSGASVNGAVVHCLWLTRELAQRGHRVTLVCRPAAWIASQSAPGVEVIASDLQRWPPAELRRIACAARDRGVDVLHTHMSRAHFFGVLLRGLSGVPSVATAHSQHLQLHWMLNDGVIAVSAATAKFHRRWNVVRRGRLEVIHNFIDVDRYASVAPEVGGEIRAQLGIDRTHPLIGIIGDVIPRKGLADLLRALAAIRSDAPDTRLLVVGSMEDVYAQAMRQLAEALGISAQVVWAGYRNDIAAVLSAVDVVVCPSHHDDLSLVALESMAAGRPVVATTVGGFPECVLDGVTGLLAPPRDPQRLAAALVALLSDPERRRRLGQAATAHAREHFSAARQVPRIEAVLSRAAMAAKRSPRRPWPRAWHTSR